MKNAIIAPQRWKYFRDTRSLSRERILVSDYENMGGRVARYGYVSDYGRAVFVTTSYVDYKFYYDHYIKGPVEDMHPALKRKEMGRHIINLVASNNCCGEDEIKSFLKKTFTGLTIWNAEMTEDAYDRELKDTIHICLKENFIVRADGGTFAVTEAGKVVARSGITLATAAFFMKFLTQSDPHGVSALEILLLLSLCRDSLDHCVSRRRSEGRWVGYREELIRIIRENGEEDKPLFQSLWELDHLLLDEKDRAAMKALMMQDWLTSVETKEIEWKFKVFSGAIKKIGEEFSWLAETLAALARIVGWEKRFIMGIICLSQRLIHGIAENGLALSNIRIWGLGRNYINLLLHEGYNTPEAVSNIPLAELERLLPGRMAVRLYCHYHREYQKYEDAARQEAAVMVRDAEEKQYGRETAEHCGTDANSMLPMVAVTQPSRKAGTSMSSVTAAAKTAITNMIATIKTTTTPASDDYLFPCGLAELLNNKTLLFALRTRLADTHDLRTLIADPPTILMDESQKLFFYQGVQIVLQPACFHYLLLLTEKPKQIVTRDEIYRRLWPGPMNYDGSNKPYDRQISDQKRRCVAQIKKGIADKIDITPGELDALIVTRPKVGYMLNLGQEEVLILKAQ